MSHGLLAELFIQPRPPPSRELESVRGSHTEVNETARRRRERGGELCVYECAYESEREKQGGEGEGSEM